MQCSMQFNDSNAQITQDIKYACAQGADVIGFTEVDQNMRSLWKREVRDNGYHPVVPHDAATPFAVKLNGPSATFVMNQGGVKVLEANLPHYGARYITWVKIRWHDQEIWVHEGHWARTKWGEGKHKDMSNAMAAQVKLHGNGREISFWMGDLNIDVTGDGRVQAANLNQIFRGNGLLSIFDELHANPPKTHESGTYDVIGCYRPDRQVKGTRYKVHPKQRSDHSFVSAFYDIDISFKVGVGHEQDWDWQNIDWNGGWNDYDQNGTESTPEYVDPDFYATGGNISWADYLDNELYPLPYATGDSDLRGDSPAS